MAPLKIVKRIAEAPSPAVARPGEVTTSAKKPLKLIKKPLSPMAQKAIDGIIGGKLPTQAMLDAGYAPATAKNPGQNLMEKPAVKDAMDPFVTELLAHRNEILVHMRSAVGEAEYSELATGLNAIIKNIQLLTGKATGKIGFDLDSETKEAIKAVIGLNAD